MRKVISAMQVSLDGYCAGPNGEMDWISANDETWAYVFGHLKQVDTVLLGRNLYEGFVAYWPAAGANPESSKDEKTYSAWIEKTPKVVFSRTLAKAEYNNSRIVRDDLAGEIARLKQQPGENMELTGGVGLLASFLQLGLVDGFRLVVNPVALGGGVPLFQNLKDRLNLKLVNTKQFETGAVALEYEVVK